jgi:hypothetical protein
MTRQYLIGELSVRLEQLQATTSQAVPEVARLRTEVETGPLTGLASATARAMALADRLCWASLSRGDTTAFAAQATILAELYQFDISVRLLGLSLSRLRSRAAPEPAPALVHGTWFGTFGPGWSRAWGCTLPMWIRPPARHRPVSSPG